MDQYYYTVSSLPFLEIDSQPSISYSEFLNICRTTLSDRDFAIISSISLNKINNMEFSNPVIKKWISWEGSLRNELVKLRAVFLDFDPEEYLSDLESSTESPFIARTAFKMKSPLSGEEVINKGRWDYLDELEQGHYFDLEKLIDNVEDLFQP